MTLGCQISIHNLTKVSDLITALQTQQSRDILSLYPIIAVNRAARRWHHPRECFILGAFILYPPLPVKALRFKWKVISAPVWRFKDTLTFCILVVFWGKLKYKHIGPYFRGSRYKCRGKIRVLASNLFLVIW